MVWGRLEGDKGREDALLGQDVKKLLTEEQDSCLLWRYGEADFPGREEDGVKFGVKSPQKGSVSVTLENCYQQLDLLCTVLL